MKFQLPDGNFAIVRWKYDRTEVTTSNGKSLGETDEATCCIKTVSEDGVPVMNDICGSVRRYVYDPFDREVARKESLRKALDLLYPIEKLKVNGEPSESQLKELVAKLKAKNAPNKLYRSLFWDAYLTRNDKFLEALPIS